LPSKFDPAVQFRAKAYSCFKGHQPGHASLIILWASRETSFCAGYQYNYISQPRNCRHARFVRHRLADLWRRQT